MKRRLIDRPAVRLLLCVVVVAVVVGSFYMTGPVGP